MPWPRGPTCPAPRRRWRRFYWTFEEVDEHLKAIMTDLYRNASAAAAQYGMAGNLAAGANIAGFVKVADAMLAYGIV